MSRSAFNALFEAELAVYRQIDAKLVPYADSLDTTQAAALLEDHKAVPKLLEDQATIFKNLMEDETFRLENSAFFYFIEKTIKLDGMTEIDRLHLSLNIFKLMQCDVGETLIKTLNKQNQSDGLQITTQQSEGRAIGITMPGFKKQKVALTSKTEPAPNFLFVFFDAIVKCLLLLMLNVTTEKVGQNLIPKREAEKPKTWNTFTLHTPTDLQQKKPLLFSGKKQALIIEVSFISIAHELIHIFHYSTGIARSLERNIAMQTNPLLYLYAKWMTKFNAEEYFTIEGEDNLTNISENSFRSAFNFLLRGSHISSPLTTYAPKKTGIKTQVWLGKKRIENKKLSRANAFSLMTFNTPNGDPNGRHELPTFEEDNKTFFTDQAAAI